MPWKSLAARLNDDEIPLVLAGPILRRVEPNEVTVWLALRESASVVLKIYDRDNPGASPIPLLLQGRRATVAIGKQLHMVAVTATVQEATLLQPGCIYFYDLEISTATGVTLLSTTSSFVEQLTYAGFSLPSFSLPPTTVEHLHVLHASCRKPHGQGLDALQETDTILRETAHNPNLRPHYLFLTGDQIYADDVADVLLHMLRDASDVLLGWGDPNRPFVQNVHSWTDEVLPEVGRESYRRLVPGQRASLTRNVAGFTSTVGGGDGVAKSHLLTLGEFLAMYLFAWSDALWPPYREAQRSIFDFNDTYPKPREVYPQSLSVWWNSPHSDYEGYLGVKEFQRTLPVIRRALANVPVYMMFDDHEITDDWFISWAWCAEVMQRPLGRRALTNGLCAFAVCQAWGNTPERFVDATPGGRLLNVLEQLNKNKGESEAAREQITHLVGLPYGADEVKLFLDDLSSNQRLVRKGTRPWHDSLHWHYRLERPGYEFIVLDTRTWRGFKALKNRRDQLLPVHKQINWPALISDEGFFEQIPIGQPNDAEITFVISPTPVVGIPIIEAFQRGGDRKARLADDNETWSFDQEAFETLLAMMVYRNVNFDPISGAITNRHDKHRIVWLSGDVHYGFTGRLEYWAQVPYTIIKIPAQLVCIQLTASACKNEASGTRYLQTFDLRWLTTPSEGYVAFFNPLKRQLSYTYWIRPNPGYDIINTSPQKLPRTVTDELVVLTTSDLESISFTPDWVYRVDFVRADTDLILTPRPAPNSNVPGTHLALLADAGTTHGHYQSVIGGRGIVGHNNIGQIHIRGSGNDSVLEHRLRWLYWFNELSERVITTHVVPLGFDLVDYPKPNVKTIPDDTE
jgi:hypothetical protein